MSASSIKTTRTTLRPAAPNDYTWLHEAGAEESVAAWWDTGDGTAWVQDLEDDPELHGHIVEASGQKAGFVQWYESDDPDYRYAGMDIFLIPEFQGQGYGAEVIKGLSKWLFEQRGHHRLFIDPAAENQRAIDAYKSVGFKPIGVARQRERTKDGKWRDSLLMDMLKEDFRE